METIKMKTPKEKAIEKIAKIIMVSDGADYTKSCFDDYELYKNNAKAIIEALPVEFADNESEPMEGDFYKDSFGHGYTLSSSKDSGDVEHIIQRNNRPVINVDDMGV